VLPGESRPTFRAATWFTGEAPFPEPDSGPGIARMEVRDAGSARPLALYRAHDQAFYEEVEAMSKAAEVAEAAAGTADETLRRALEYAVLMGHRHADEQRTAARALREYAADLGLIPPERVICELVPAPEDLPEGENP